MNKASSSLVLFVVLVSSAIWVMSTSLAAAALPRMEAYFLSTGTAGFQAKYILIIPSLTIALCSPFVGKLIDRWGGAKVLMRCVILIGLAGPLTTFLDNVWLIYLGRVGVGLAVTGIMVSIPIITAQVYSGSDRSRVFGWISAAITFGAVFWYFIGGQLANLSWRTPFLCFFCVWLLVPVLRKLKMVLPVVRQKSSGFAQVWKTFGKQPRLVIPFGLGFFMVMLIFFVPLKIPFLLSDELGFTKPSTAGLTLAIHTIVSGFTGLIYGRIRKILSRRHAILIGLFAVGLAYVLAGTNKSLFVIWVAMGLVGVGISLSLPTFTLWVSEESPAVIGGQMMGTLHSAYFFGQFVSPFLFEPVARLSSIAQTFFLFGVAGLGLALVLFPLWIKK